MPLYEYRCANEHITTTFANVSQIPSAIECEKCKKRATKLLASGIRHNITLYPRELVTTGEVAHSDSDADRKISAFKREQEATAKPLPDLPED